MINILLVFVGGGIGSICRYGLGIMFNPSQFPYGTLLANVLSCILLGILIGLNADKILKDHHKVLLMTGFCGGFSTFSTYSAEIVKLYQDGSFIMAAVYLIGSVILGLVAIFLGISLTRLLA